MAKICIKTEVQLVIEVSDAAAARMTKQDVCDTAAGILSTKGGGEPALASEIAVGVCTWTLEPNFGNIPADEATVCWSEGFDQINE